MSEIVGVGRRDGTTIKVKSILELEGDKKDYILRKTGPNRVELFRVIPT